MNTTSTPSPEFTRLACVIFQPSPFGRMYLCADGTTSSERAQAAVHWLSQAQEIIRENWIVNTPAPAQVEIVPPTVQGGAPYFRRLGEQDAFDLTRKRKRAVPQNYKLAYEIGWYEAKKNANATLPGKPFHPGETLFDDTCAG